MGKSKEAFRTIGEVADWLDTQAHVLRFWESKFSQVKPIKRAGGRRYYRPADMLLLGGIKKLLHDDGMTIKGAQKLMREQGVKHISDLSQMLEDDLTDEIQGTPIVPTAEDSVDIFVDVPLDSPKPATVLEFAKPDKPVPAAPVDHEFAEKTRDLASQETSAIADTPVDTGDAEENDIPDQDEMPAFVQRLSAEGRASGEDTQDKADAPDEVAEVAAIDAKSTDEDIDAAPVTDDEQADMTTPDPAPTPVEAKAPAAQDAPAAPPIATAKSPDLPDMEPTSSLLPDLSRTTSIAPENLDQARVLVARLQALRTLFAQSENA